MDNLAETIGINGASRLEAGQRAERHTWANWRAAKLIEAMRGVGGGLQGYASSGVAGVGGEADYAALRADVAAFLRSAATNIEGLS